MQSQINSGYECNEVDVVETGYASGPINLTMSVDDQSQSQTISIDGNGTYFIQFPGFLVNNLVSLEFSMPDGASFGLPTIYSTPCPVATKTPTPASTNTPNPSDTPTPVPNTNTPGPSPTITRIPTHTPLPSGHSTFTPTGTPVATDTPVPGTVGFDCGTPDMPVYNCNLVDSVATGGAAPASLAPVAPHWVASPLFGQHILYATVCTGWSTCNTANGGGWGAAHPHAFYLNGNFDGGQNSATIIQSVHAYSSGRIHFSGTEYTVSDWGGTLGIAFCVSDTNSSCTDTQYTNNTSGSFDISTRIVSAGSDYYIWMYGISQVVAMSSIYMVTTGATSTPAPTSLPGGSPTLTPPPNPFGTASPIPSDTPCPSGCAVAALTTVPGFSTVVTIDTSPFSPLTHLSLGRSPCTPFGYVQIPYPVITGTPVMGQPLQFAWTVPVTHTWDDTHIITNTAIQPCAMVGEISPYVWDFTYWGSGFGLFVVFTLWLIGWIGRLSGDHTIDG